MMVEPCFKFINTLLVINESLCCSRLYIEKMLQKFGYCYCLHYAEGQQAPSITQRELGINFKFMHFCHDECRKMHEEEHKCMHNFLLKKKRTSEWRGFYTLCNIPYYSYTCTCGMGATRYSSRMKFQYWTRWCWFHERLCGTTLNKP